MSFDCEKVRHLCKSECCGPCPIPVATWKRHKWRSVSPITYECDDGQGYVHHVTLAGHCAMLGRDGRCMIYPTAQNQPDERADICRIFGDERHLLMTCRWMDKGGRVRSRQERRAITERIKAAADKAIDNMRRNDTQEGRQT